ncbi:TonB family protein [Lewinella cohaerens]|uniref:TonB family protein n=1 Tax=Lewinella cohaerens TaxID=70995 RepID=UPI00037917BE|nr:TonB family protein [Lewinella cohaerens]
MAKNRAGRPSTTGQLFPPSKGDTYFLGIGIDDYQYWPSLNNAVRDVKAVSELLIRDFGLPRQKVTLLFNKEATRENIILALEKMAATVTSQDSLLVYYAGHGHLNNRQRGFWVPTDAPRDGISYYIPNSTIRDYLGDIPSLHTLLVSDACFSGSLFVRGERSGELVASELAQLPSRWAICSGRHDEVVADGPAGQHSPFAESILDVLRTTARPYITTNFLLGQVREQTRSNYEQLPDGGPIHGVGHKRGEFIFRRSQEEGIAWTEAQTAGTLEAFQQFAHLFPKGKHQEEAQKVIKKLSAAASWKRIAAMPDEKLKEIDAKRQEVRTYCQEFPQSTYFDEALAMGLDLEHKRAFISVYDSEFGLLGFIRKDTPYKEAAQQRLAQLTQETASSSVTEQPTQSILREEKKGAIKKEKPPVPVQRLEKTSPQASGKETSEILRSRSNIIWGSVLGLVTLLLLIWGVKKCTGPSAEEIAASKVEKQMKIAIQDRDIKAAKTAVADYRRVPNKFQDENIVRRVNEFIASYTDSIEQAQNKQPAGDTPLSREDFKAPPLYINTDPVVKKTEEASQQTTASDDKIYFIVKNNPLYPGCSTSSCSNRALTKFIAANLKYPSEGREKGLEARAMVSFVIEKDGSMTNIQMVNDPGNGFGKEAFRVFQAMQTRGNRWTPGNNGGPPLRTKMNYPVNFKLQ